MKEMSKRKKDGGFTLIELMIVIAVIGILAVVLVPKMSGLKTGAKVTGVQTNVVSVQAYVVSKMDKWIYSNKTNVQIAQEISKQFSGDNALKNPLSGLTTHSSNIALAELIQTNSSGVAQTAAVAGTLVSTDALQILSALPGTPYLITTPVAGTVVVVVPATVTTGIQIIGYDETGNIVDSILYVKP